MSEALIPLESVNAVEVFTGGGLDDLLARIRAEAVTLVPNVKTVAGRKEIASIAYKVSRSKTAIDDAGKALVADLKKQTGDIDSARKKARDTLDALRDEVRKPLTDWEQEQARIERERVEAEERARAAAEEARLAEIARKEEEIRAREEAVRAAEEAERQRAAAEQAERERVEREARLQAEAAENAKREAAAAVERAEREAREATERAAREAAEAEQRAKDAAERAEREKAEAVAAAERRAQEEAERAERERQAQADAQRKADEARAADVEHRRSINRAAMAALIAQGISEDDAATVITAIVQGKVPAVAIRY
jgi:membrane protein involved in colicin uptake